MFAKITRQTQIKSMKMRLGRGAFAPMAQPVRKASGFPAVGIIFHGGYASTIEAEAKPPKYLCSRNGKPEAYRHVLRQSRKPLRAIHELRFQSWRASLTVGKHRAAEADGPAMILIDKEKTFEGV